MRNRKQTMVELKPLTMADYDGTSWAAQYGISPTRNEVEQAWAAERETARTQELEVIG